MLRGGRVDPVSSRLQRHRLPDAVVDDRAIFGGDDESFVVFSLFADCPGAGAGGEQDGHEWDDVLHIPLPYLLPLPGPAGPTLGH